MAKMTLNIMQDYTPQQLAKLIGEEIDNTFGGSEEGAKFVTQFISTLLEHTGDDEAVAKMIAKRVDGVILTKEEHAELKAKIKAAAGKKGNGTSPSTEQPAAQA